MPTKHFPLFLLVIAGHNEQLCHFLFTGGFDVN